ncbi:MAG: DUF1097 domain-containing protein [Beijerinckiaceae bacterium]|nr:DUF1097 domain-containing protein [Beijerinckiaceae bacterium]
MDMITALAVSIGLLGGVATWLFLGPLGALGLSIWAAFVGWATFYHSGGKEAGLKKAIVNNLFGAVVAWVALILISKIPLAGSLGLPVWAAICVAITVFVLVYAAKYPLLGEIPAGVLGYASVVALALASGKLDTLTAASFANPLVSIAVSLVIGALFGYASEKAAGAIAK